MTKKLIIAALAGASIFAAAPASATDFTLTFSNGAADFGNSFGAQGQQDDRFLFNLTGTSTITTSVVTSITNPLTPPYQRNFDFSSIAIVNSATNAVIAAYTPVTGDPIEMQSLNVVLGAGSYAVRVQGNVPAPATAGAYSGTINVVQGAVPEPATWGMMILGFGLIGAASRRSRKVTSVLA